MIKNDFHVHTSFSSDSTASMESMIQRGIELKLNGMCFTDHMDYDFPQQYSLPFTYNVTEQKQEFERLHAMYKSKIQLFRGIEMGLKLSAKEQIGAALKEILFDYVIGSVHIVNDLDPYHSAYWESFSSEKEGLLKYFETTLTCITEIDDFDSLGHLDYIVRYAPNPTMYSYETFRDIIDEILQVLVDKNKAMEINTSGLRKQGATNPNMMILRRYLDLGGEKITIGSDGHAPEYLAYGFDKIETMLKENGLRYYVTHNNRKPQFHTI